MVFRVASYPPLGRDRVIPTRQTDVAFSVLLETDATPENGWAVELWHGNCDDPDDWSAVPLNKSQDHTLYSQSQAPCRQWYTGSISCETGRRWPIGFTIRGRQSRDHAWTWAREQCGIADGRLLFQNHDRPEYLQFGHYIQGTNPNLTVEPVQSEVPDTCLWQLTALAAAANGSNSGSSHFVLGLPTDFVRWFALVRTSTAWLAPRHGRKTPLAERDAVLYGFLRVDGFHVVVLAISGGGATNVFQAEQDKLVIESRNALGCDAVTNTLIAVGGSFDQALAAVVYRARALVLLFTHPQVIDAAEHFLHQRRSTRYQEGGAQEWYDGLTYCTWNSLGKDLMDEKILAALKSLKDAGIQVSNLIIDDGWQSLDSRNGNQLNQRWTDFEADPKAFPGGLKNFVRRVREDYPHITHVAVWHALLGYWGGISPGSWISKHYKTWHVPVQHEDDTGTEIDLISADDARKFYEDFYNFLGRSGIDAVKTDVQCALDTLTDARQRSPLTEMYLSSWTTAYLQHFSDRTISCMSQKPYILFSYQLSPQMGPPIPWRNSHDYYPNANEAHAWHIFCNAHNALLASYLNVVPDWDMFQTRHTWAGFHAAARAVSGGPVSITDEPGSHNIEIIRQLTSVTPKGRTTLLRPSCFGRSLDAYNGIAESAFCTVGSYDGPMETGASFVGVFNCTAGDSTEILHLCDLRGIDRGTNYIIRSFRTGSTSQLMAADEGEAVVGVALEGHGWDVLTATPTYLLKPHPRQFTFASNLGFPDKLTGAAAISFTHVSLANDDTRVRVQTTLKALGNWAVWISDLAPSLDYFVKNVDVDDDVLVLFKGGTVVPRHCVWVCGARADAGPSTSGGGGGILDGHKGAYGSVVYVDLERAWKELGLETPYNDMVCVEMFVTLAKTSWVDESDWFEV